MSSVLFYFIGRQIRCWNAVKACFYQEGFLLLENEVLNAHGKNDYNFVQTYNYFNYIQHHSRHFMFGFGVWRISCCESTGWKDITVSESFFYCAKCADVDRLHAVDGNPILAGFIKANI